MHPAWLAHDNLTPKRRENEDPKTSPHLRATAPDRLDALAALLSRADVAKLSPATQLAAVTALKILSRVSGPAPDCCVAMPGRVEAWQRIHSNCIP